MREREGEREKPEGFYSLREMSENPNSIVVTNPLSVFVFTQPCAFVYVLIPCHVFA